MKTRFVVALLLLRSLTAGPALPQGVPRSGAALPADSLAAMRRRARELDSLSSHAPIRRASALPPFPLRLVEPRSAGAGITFRELAGRTVSSDTLRGRVAVIDFWGVWCKECLPDLPEIQRAWERYRADADVVFLTIDIKDTPEMVRAFMRAHHYDFPVLLDYGYADRAGVVSVPTSLVLDRSGRKRFPREGRPIHDEIVRLVEAARAAVKAAPKP